MALLCHHVVFLSGFAVDFTPGAKMRVPLFYEKHNISIEWYRWCHLLGKNDADYVVCLKAEFQS